jgi:uncharacterized protein (DUF2384 family)
MVALGIPPAQAVTRLQHALGMSSESLAHALGTTPRTIERWRTGVTHPQHEARRRLAALVALERRLGETFDSPDAAREWLQVESRYLGGLTPAEVVQVGRFDRVNAALDALDAGVFV